MRRRRPKTVPVPDEVGSFNARAWLGDSLASRFEAWRYARDLWEEEHEGQLGDTVDRLRFELQERRRWEAVRPEPDWSTPSEW